MATRKNEKMVGDLVALGTVKHDGEMYEEGDSLPSMPEKQAAQLVASGGAGTRAVLAARKKATSKSDDAAQAREQADAAASSAEQAQADAEARAREESDAAARIAGS